MWHVLALALGGRTVAEWQAAMSQAEFLRWLDFYERHPFDDAHRYHRPAALVASSMAGKIVEKLEWLTAAIRRDDGFTDVDHRTMAAFGVKRPQRSTFH